MVLFVQVLYSPEFLKSLSIIVEELAASNRGKMYVLSSNYLKYATCILILEILHISFQNFT
jgi:hypothetical protein